MPCFEDEFRPKKNQVIGESCDQRHPIRHRIDHEPEEEKCGKDPGRPFDFYRQNEKQVDDFIGIKPGEREKQRAISIPLEKLLPKKNAAAVVPIMPTRK